MFCVEREITGRALKLYVFFIREAKERRRSLFLSHRSPLGLGSPSLLPVGSARGRTQGGCVTVSYTLLPRSAPRWGLWPPSEATALQVLPLCCWSPLGGSCGDAALGGPDLLLLH